MGRDGVQIRVWGHTRRWFPVRRPHGSIRHETTVAICGRWRRWLWGRPHRCQRHHLRHPGPRPLNFNVTQTFSFYTNHNSITYLSNPFHQSNSIYINHTTITNYIHLSIPSHSILKFETEFYRVCNVQFQAHKSGCEGRTLFLNTLANRSPSSFAGPSQRNLSTQGKHA